MTDPLPKGEGLTGMKSGVDSETRSGLKGLTGDLDSILLTDEVAVESLISSLPREGKQLGKD